MDEGEETLGWTCDMGLFARTGKSERSSPLLIADTDEIVSVLLATPGNRNETLHD